MVIGMNEQDPNLSLAPLVSAADAEAMLAEHPDIRRIINGQVIEYQDYGDKVIEGIVAVVDSDPTTIV